MRSLSYSSTGNPFPITYIPALLTSLPPPSPLCGNTQLNTGEECDDGNKFDLDGCSAYCLFENGICGDGVIQSLMGEQCEKSKPTILPCQNNCRFLLVSCGDKTLDAGESCDEGPLNSNSPGSFCRPDCSYARCGDYIVDAAEQCDDGNRIPGDGCDAFCARERGSALNTEPSTLPATVVDLPFTPSNVVPTVPSTQNPTTALLTNQNLQGAPSTTDSGPEAIAIMASGAAAGWAWMRRRKLR